MAEAASRMTGKPGLCIGTLGPGMANIAGAIQCAKVENSPVIFLGGQRARITERRVRRGRIQFVRQEPLFAASVKYSASIEYADQTDEIVHEAIRQAMSGTPGPAYIEYPSHIILEELDVPDPLAPNRYRLVNQTAGEREVAEAAVVPAKDEIKGKLPDLYVALKPGLAPSEAIRKRVEDSVIREIGAIARPRRVVIVPDMPKTRSGKIMRRVLAAISNNENEGDISTLANPEIVNEIRNMKY